MNRASSSLAALLLALASCASVGRHGAAVPSKPAVDAVRLMEDPAAYDGADLVVEGRVSEVCLVKGCWLLARDGDRTMRVTFKDYGFFVPTDCAGDLFRAEGRFIVIEEPIELARHYLEDAGRHEEAKAINAPVRTLTFVANGIELRED